MSKPLRRLPALAAVVVIAVLALAGCGHSKSKNEDAQALLKATFTGPHRVDSGRLAVALTVATGPQKGLEIGVSGPFTRGRAGEVPKLSLQLTARSPKKSIDAGVTSTATQLFVRRGHQNYVLPPAAFSLLQQSYKTSAAQSGGKPLLSRLGVALHWLRDPKVVGDSDVGGTPARHITATIDVKALSADLGSLMARLQALPIPRGRLPTFSPEQRARLEKAVQGSSVEVFTGRDDKTVRRLSLRLRLAAAPSPGSGASLPPTDVSFSLELTELNQPQSITAPAHAKPLGQRPGGALRGLGAPGGT
jgi:hypothetical protein